MTNNKGSHRDVSDLIREDGGAWALSNKEYLNGNSLGILQLAHSYMFGSYSQGEVPLRVRATANALELMIKRLRDQN